MTRHASTTLLGPYDNLATHEKTMCCGALPNAVRHRLFSIFLPRRGAIDKVITRSLYLLDAYLTLHPELFDHDEYTREQITNEILNSFAQHLTTLSPSKLTQNHD